MDWDDIRPPKTTTGVAIGETLETLSVAELEARVGALQDEIARVTGELNRKKAHEAAASALFKS